jgi:hypothetical protein
MSDTPRNDSLTSQLAGCSAALHFVLVDELSRKLERELAEARRQVEALVKAAQNVPCTYCEALDFCDNRKPDLTCPETLLAWSVEEAKKGV